MVKNRKISKKDWEKLQTFVKTEYDRRKTSDFRKSHEEKWKEVDRQLRMEPLRRVDVNGHEMEQSWQAEIELGEIAKVSEVLTADIMRITFPAERDWFEPHVEIPGIEDEQGNEIPDEASQVIADGTCRALFSQQHQDFWFKRRFELSVKEALHHGGFVATAEWYKDMQVMDGSKVKHVGSPVWVPHSMWNCYPDDSPRCVAQNMFYSGSMIIESYMPRWKLEMQRGQGWMPARFGEIPEDEHQVGEHGAQRSTKDLKIITYYGDAAIERKSTEDIFLPNSKIILANGVIVFWDTNDLPYPEVIYGGYEKQDPRDPYFTSPIVKLSAMGKAASIAANKFLDGIALQNERPLVYDSNDPEFALNGGPRIFPGAATGTKGGGQVQQLDIGDPQAALAGLEMILRTMQEGTGVNSVRAGTPNSDRQTATEVQKIAQGAEVRTVDFIDKLNGYLRTWLHMQNDLNRKHLKEYIFYSDQMDTKDFLRITGEQYKKTSSIVFDVVGSKGILGEEQRMARQMNVTAFASGNQIFAPLIQEKARELLLSMYKDAGTKNPERFVGGGQQMEDPRLAEMQQVIQMLQGGLQKAQEDTQVKIAEIERKREESAAKLQQAQQEKMLEVEQQEKDRIAEYTMHIEKLRADMEKQRRELTGQFSDALKDITHKLEVFKAQQMQPIGVVTTKGAELDAELKGMANQITQVEEKATRPRKRTVRFIDDDTAEIEDIS